MAGVEDHDTSHGFTATAGFQDQSLAFRVTLPYQIRPL